MITQSKIESLQKMYELQTKKISFDFDGTLTIFKYQNLVKELLKEAGNIIYIISARDNASYMYTTANRLGIPMNRVIATGSNESKIEKIKELGIQVHYDDNSDVVDKLPGIGKLVR